MDIWFDGNDLYVVDLSLFSRCQSLLSSIGSKVDKENALRCQLMYATDKEEGV